MAQARRKTGWLDATTLGALQGFSFNFGDELARAMGDQSYTQAVQQAQADRPGLFATGQVLGNVGPWSRIAGLAMRGAKTGLPFISRAAAIDAASGGAYGAGGAHAGDVSLDERLESGGRGAAIGALTAGLVPLAFRNIDQARMNLPVLQGKPPLHADQSLVFAGGRNADEVVGEALARDEALARAGGQKTLFGRNGVEGAPVDIDGPNVRSLFDTAARSPKGREVAGKNADMRLRDAADARLRSAWGADERPVVMSGAEDRLKKGAVEYRTQARENMATLEATHGAEMQDLVAALDDAAAHNDWVRFARETFDGDVEMQTAAARRIFEHINRRMKAASGEELRALLDRLGPSGDLTKKLKALGVTFDKAAKGKAPYAPRQGEFTNAEDRLALREPAVRTPKGREEPAGMERAALSDADAQALMEQLHASRRVNYVPARDARTPMLEVQGKKGVKWENPFAVDPRLGMAAYYTGKPTAVIVDQEMHGGGLSLLPRDIAELARETDARRKPTARNRWAYLPA